MEAWDGDPATDPARLAALAGYDILDSAPEPGFDDIVHLTARLCDTPVALVSLVDRARQWFKASVGFPECETDLGSSVCRFALVEPDLLVIPDLTRDPRTARNPLVTGEAGIRFYAGAPLRTPDGFVIGSLCAIDTTARPQGLTAAQADDLRRLGRQVMSQMEARRLLAERERAAAAARRSAGFTAALLALGDRLREVPPEDMPLVAARAVGEALGATRAGLGVVDDIREVVAMHTDWCAAGAVSIAGPHPFRNYGAVVEDMRRGELVVVPDVEHDPRTAHRAAVLLALGVRTLVNVPVIEHGRLVAMMFVHHAAARPWLAEEAGFVRSVADRTRAAMERRSAEARLHQLNATLERRVAERTRESERMWMNAREFYLIVGRDGVYRRANPTWEREFGYTPESLVGASATDLLHPDDLERLVGAVTGAAADGSPISFEARIRRADGTYRNMSWTGVVGDEEVYAFGRDITEQRAVEEALRQAQKMEAVGQLTGGLAHDFNNLLTGVTGALELLQRRVGQGRFDEADRYVALAQGAAGRAAALTQRLLAFSRRQTLDPRPTDVNRLVVGMAELIRRSIGPGIVLDLATAGELWPTLIDPPQLENALLNLCINARDAMPDGGRLTVETANAQLAGGFDADLPAGDYVVVSVADTGSGMAPEVMARIFDPFFTTKPVGQGTGLGLSMIYGFTHQSGGAVSVQSEPGRGTTLSLFLPRSVEMAREGVAATAAEVAAGVRGVAATILVVDDEPSVRTLVQEVLAEAGHAVVEAKDGAGALTVLRSDAAVDLLVTDVGLPGAMNGRQVADAARALRPGLRVLFMTGYAAAAAVGAGSLEPGMALMTKPFVMSELARRVEALLADDLAA